MDVIVRRVDNNLAQEKREFLVSGFNDSRTANREWLMAGIHECTIVRDLGPSILSSTCILKTTN